MAKTSRNGIAIPAGFHYNREVSYQTYITDAVVVGSYASNTADKSYRLFTERAGMLYASARSVREERSRQRYALQDFSHITVTLVKGKAGWRIGSVEPHQNFYAIAESRAARGSIVRLTKTLRRYVHGEIPDPLLYATYLEALEVLVHECESRALYERCAEVRLLAQLGYVASDTTIDFALTKPLHQIASDELLPFEAYLESLYRGAQAASHLAEVG
jgi:recombinational DNA repair protein (RecF pathway)